MGEYFKFLKTAEADVEAWKYMTYVCEHCEVSFASFYSLRAHQNGNRRDGVPLCQSRQTRDVSTVCSDGDTSDSASSAAAATITNPFDIKHEICRRHQQHCTLAPPQPLDNVGMSAVQRYTGSVNYGSLVSAFDEYCKWVLQSRSNQFWSLYLSTRHLHTEQQRNILGLVLKIFKTTGKWCRDKRAVRNLLNRKPFWPLVTYTYTCDLSSFQVPGLGCVTYSFVDPIFAWIMQARKLCKKYALLFRYREGRRRGEQTWGSCVSCGQVM